MWVRSNFLGFSLSKKNSSKNLYIFDALLKSMPIIREFVATFCAFSYQIAIASFSIACCHLFTYFYLLRWQHRHITSHIVILTVLDGHCNSSIRRRFEIKQRILRPDVQLLLKRDRRSSIRLRNSIKKSVAGRCSTLLSYRMGKQAVSAITSGRFTIRHSFNWAIWCRSVVNQWIERS